MYAHPSLSYMMMQNGEGNMELDTLITDTKKAFEKNECYELLTGTDEYYLPVYDIPIRIPTDWSRLIPDGIHAVFSDTQDRKILEQYEQAIARLLAGSGREVWIAAHVLFAQLDTEFSGNASFTLNRNIFPLFHKAVEDHLSELQTDMCGWGEMTLYQDILRMNRILLEDYSIQMLVTTGEEV